MPGRSVGVYRKPCRNKTRIGAIISRQGFGDHYMEYIVPRVASCGIAMQKKEA